MKVAACCDRRPPYLVRLGCCCLDTYELAWRFLEMLTDSLLSTVRSVCELSRIFRYAASVSWITFSYSFLVSICNAARN